MEELMEAVQRALDGIPEKTYYRIGEVAKHTGIKPYVLRFWETEFKMMMPPKSRSRQRMYRRRDIETILTIKELLYTERFTIEGARKRLVEIVRGRRSEVQGLGSPAKREFGRIRNELRELRELLASS
jgi:DNA-binding transcriptional MerR regulator